jgi:catechol 2,3-dioxygenase-like lactoylglutathione lyase family enzyme
MKKITIMAAGLCVAAFLPTSRSRAADKIVPTAMEPRISVITLGVADLQKSYLFYKAGLGFPTKMTPDGGIVLFALRGTRLFLYPYAKLAEDCRQKASETGRVRDVFAGVTFGHCTRKKEDVDAILLQAEKAGGKIVKAAKETAWGGYSGYFADPDGYLWEVAYSDQWKFNPDGSLLIDEPTTPSPE